MFLASATVAYIDFDFVQSIGLVLSSSLLLRLLQIFLNSLIIKANDEKEKDCCYSFVAYLITAVLILGSYAGIFFFYLQLPKTDYDDILFAWIYAISIDVTVLEILLEFGLRISECMRELAARHAGRKKQEEEDEPAAEEEEDQEVQLGANDEQTRNQQEK